MKQKATHFISVPMHNSSIMENFEHFKVLKIFVQNIRVLGKWSNLLLDSLAISIRYPLARVFDVVLTCPVLSTCATGAEIHNRP